MLHYINVVLQPSSSSTSTKAFFSTATVLVLYHCTFDYKCIYSSTSSISLKETQYQYILCLRECVCLGMHVCMTICIHAHKHIHMKECICASMHLFTHACMYTAPSVSAVPMFVGGRTYVLPTTLHHISACVVRLLCLLLGMRCRRPLWVRQALHVKTLHSIKGPLQQQRGPFSGGTANSCRPRAPA